MLLIKGARWIALFRTVLAGVRIWNKWLKISYTCALPLTHWQPIDFISLSEAGQMKASQPPQPHPGDLIKVIRALAANGKVSFSRHALDERMDQRGIEISDVLEIFRLGDIEGDIKPGAKQGEWSCLVRGRPEWASRDAGVATVVVSTNRLIVKTTQWMDR